MKVRVIGHYRVVHAGQAFTPGQLADVPDAIAKNWLLWGYVEAVDPQPAAAPDEQQPEQPEQAEATEQRRR